MDGNEESNTSEPCSCFRDRETDCGGLWSTWWTFFGRYITPWWRRPGKNIMSVVKADLRVKAECKQHWRGWFRTFACLMYGVLLRTFAECVFMSQRKTAAGGWLTSMVGKALGGATSVGRQMAGECAILSLVCNLGEGGYVCLSPSTFSRETSLGEGRALVCMREIDAVETACITVPPQDDKACFPEFRMLRRQSMHVRTQVREGHMRWFHTGRTAEERCSASSDWYEWRGLRRCPCQLQDNRLTWTSWAPTGARCRRVEENRKAGETDHAKKM